MAIMAAGKSAIQAAPIKAAFFDALDDLVTSNPWIVTADPQRDILRVKTLVVVRLQQRGESELAEKINKTKSARLIDWFRQWQVLKQKELEAIERFRQQSSPSQGDVSPVNVATPTQSVQTGPNTVPVQRTQDVKVLRHPEREGGGDDGKVVEEGRVEEYRWDVQGRYSRRVNLDVRVVALYHFLRSHPTWGPLLASAGLRSLDDFVNATVLAYWRSRGVDIALINLESGEVTNE